METGIKLINKERDEQITKHKWDYSNEKYYGKEELAQAAKFCLTLNNEDWPVCWDEHWKNKILSKNTVQRLIVSGALIAAEIDRLNFNHARDKKQ